LGLLLSRSESTIARRIPDIVEPVGTLFINAIRMTVIPLVVSLVIVGIAGADARAIGQMGVRALLTALALLCASALVGALTAPPFFDHLSLDPAAVASLRARAALAVGTAGPLESARRAPGFAQ